MNESSYISETLTDKNHDNKWDMSDVESFDDSETHNINSASLLDNDATETQLHEEIETPIADIKFWSDEYRQTEIQFANFQKQPITDRSRYYKQLAAYENDQAYNWHQLAEVTSEAQAQDFVQDSYELARVQNISTVEPSQTIEAASGAFFNQRMHELRQKINLNPDSEQQEKETSFINNTWQKVYNYVTAHNDYETLHSSYDQYRLTRRNQHNKMIGQLNGLNKLAESYGTTRFTFRDFMTNNFYYDPKKDSGGYLNSRANYDRETVLAYFKNVYSDKIKNFQAEYQKMDLFSSKS